MSAADTEQRTSIQEFFRGRNIFMTGVTGFLGHVLLDKLLRTCSDIGTIYVLMREKKGVDPSERFKSLFDNEIFTKMKEICPNYTHKVKAISGDCLKPNLGIDVEDEELLVNNIHIVFHIAATVRFDAPLKYAADMNVRCTADLINMAHRMRRLQAFVYISTLFANCAGRSIIEEKFYDPPICAEDLLTLTETLDENIIDEITPGLLGKYPNTYVYTKAISEDLCRRKSSGIPLVIFRPAIVVSTEKEPIDGWVNNVYGPTGLVAGAALGLIRSLHVDKDCIASIVPCDYVINATIAAAWDIATNKNNPSSVSTVNDSNNNDDSNVIMTNGLNRERSVPIYNFSNFRNPITWELYMREHEKHEPDVPSILSFWIYSLKLNKHNLMHRTYCLLFHLLPALLVDGVCKLLRKEPKLREAYKKIHKLLDVLAFFSVRQWQMVDGNVQKLWDKLSPDDKKIYYFDMEQLDWLSYCKTSCYGIRQYIINDPMDTIPKAIKRRTRMMFIHYSCMMLGTIIMFYLTFKLTKSFKRN